MRGHRIPPVIWTGVITFAFSFISLGPLLRAQAVAASTKVDFNRYIQPILEKSCYGCHGPKLQMSGLRLDGKKAALAGGSSGAVIVPGKAVESPLYRRVAGIGDQPRMPMGGKLDEAQIAAIRGWIDQGAEWPEGVSKEAVAIQRHWAYIAPTRPPLPKVAV